MPNKRIVLASNNAGKIREINQLLENSGIKVLPQAQFDIEDAVEDGLAFAANAIIKARHAAKQNGLPATPDDSGIEVDTLNGTPGIYSARFAGEGSSDEENLRELLNESKKVPRKRRRWCH